jgi:hypothetical protein
MELLMERFGLPPREAGNGDAELRVFWENRETIQKAAAARIEAGDMTPNGEVLLSTKAFQLAQVHLSPAITSSGKYLLIWQATKLLESILGVYACQMVAEWNQADDERTGTVYTLSLTESESGHKYETAVSPGELSSPGRLRYILAKFWSDFLEVRSRRQFRELLEAP